jgi:hypothetical protein
LPGRSAKRSRSPKLVEDEQRMIAGAFVVAVPDAHLLFAMRRAHARIHVEHRAPWRSASMNAVDPLAGKLGESDKVFTRQPLRLEAAHLTRRSRSALSRLAADDPAHRRIMPQTLGVVHVLVSGKPTENIASTFEPEQCRPFLPVRPSASASPAIALRPSASSSSR